jgi:hypothetical protein
MADFYPVLSRAIAGLSDPSPEMRRAIYDRARNVLVAQLRGIDPPLSETEIARERLGLDETIARLEAELASRAAAPIEAAGHRDVTPVEVAGSRVAGPAETAGDRAVTSAPAADKPTPSMPSAEFKVPDARSGLPLKEPDAVVPDAEKVAVKTADPASTQPSSSFPAHPLPVDLLPTDTQLGERPRIGPAPAKERNPGRTRTLFVVAAVAAVVAGIAALAYRFNVIDAAPPAVRQPQETPAGPVAQGDNGPKINERIGADGTPAGGGVGQSAPGTATGPRAEVGIAQRAVLYIETAENPQQPRTVQGRAVWRLDSENVGAGQPVETVVTAKIDIPDAGLALMFTIRRNKDAAFPASHIVGLRFTRSFDDGNGTVREAGVPQFKSDESERGAPLSAITSALGENLFVSALSNVPVEIERNLDVMTKRSWIDIPVRFASGRRGIVAFEKGLSGDQALAEAFNAWR